MTPKSEERPDALYLVDGTAQVFRAYYAIRGLTNGEGLPTNAVFGFTSMLRKLLREESPSHVVVAFDLPGETFRHEAYADYKANREAPPEDLDAQFPYVRRVCEVLGIASVDAPGFEADDLIATYAAIARRRGIPVVVVASDKDLLQLVGDGVTVFDPAKDLRLDAAGVREVFGVRPEHVRDVLGLMGDSVDNIPGVPGVGAKTAKEIVSRYGPIESIVARARAFAESLAARDAFVDALAAQDETGATEAGSALVRRLEALEAIETIEELRARFAETRAAIADWTRTPSAERRGRLAAARIARKAAKEIDKKAMRRQWLAIAEHSERAMLSRELATVDAAVEVDPDLERFRRSDIDRPAAAALFKTLGFRTLTEEFDGDPGGDGSEDGGVDASRYRTVTDRAALDRLVDAARASGRIAVDTETTSVDPMRARLVGISLAFAEGEAAYVPVGHTPEAAPEQLDLETVREALGPLLSDPQVAKVAQNLKYDLHVLRRHGFRVEGWQLDTMVAAFLLNSSRASYSMDVLAEEFLGVRTIPYAAVAGSGKSAKTLDEVEVERVARYAAEDADVTRRLADVLEPRLAERGLDRLYREVDGPVLPILARMEASGIRVDVAFLESLGGELAETIDRLRENVIGLAGRAFNLDSPKQLREVLFDEMGLRPGRKTEKGGVFSTDARTLETLVDAHPIASKILEYREVAKLAGTYVAALPGLVHPETGRIHTSFHPTGAATGRLSSSDPNLQNIPARSAVGLRIREAFVPDPGYVFLAADYSQVELRVLAHLCGDAELVEAFLGGEDIHRRTAARVEGVAPADVTPEMRRRAKAVNFGILYGMSETRLAREQGMKRTDARAFIAAYFDRFPAIRSYIDRVREDAARDGAVRTAFGRVRYFPALSGNAGRAQREQALRAAVNTTIQGTAADLMKLAMVAVAEALDDRGSGARILLQVHDELVLEVPEAEVDAVRDAVRRAMEGVADLRVPLTVECKIGGNWRDVS